MPKLTLTTNDGVLIEQFDITEMDLSKSFARMHLVNDIEKAAREARGMEIDLEAHEHDRERERDERHRSGQDTIYVPPVIPRNRRTGR